MATPKLGDYHDTLREDIKNTSIYKDFIKKQEKEDTPNAFSRGLSSFGSMTKFAATESPAALQEVYEGQKQVPESQRKFLEDVDVAANKVADAKGFSETANAVGDVLSTVATNPSEVGSFVAEQAGQNLPAIGGTLGGAGLGLALGGPIVALIGSVIGGLAGGLSTDYVAEKTQNTLKEIKNPDDFMQVYNVVKDQGLMSEIESKAFDHAMVVGAVDAASTLLTAGLMRLPVGGAVAKGLGAFATETTMEGVGEGLAQKYAYGKVDPSEVALEMIGGAGQSLATEIAVTPYDKIKASLENKVPDTPELRSAQDIAKRSSFIDPNKPGFTPDYSKINNEFKAERQKQAGDVTSPAYFEDQEIAKAAYNMQKYSKFIGQEKEKPGARIAKGYFEKLTKDYILADNPDPIKHQEAIDAIQQAGYQVDLNQMVDEYKLIKEAEKTKEGTEANVKSDEEIQDELIEKAYVESHKPPKLSEEEQKVIEEEQKAAIKAQEELDKAHAEAVAPHTEARFPTSTENTSETAEQRTVDAHKLTPEEEASVIKAPIFTDEGTTPTPTITSPSQVENTQENLEKNKQNDSETGQELLRVQQEQGQEGTQEEVGGTVQEQETGSEATSTGGILQTQVAEQPKTITRKNGEPFSSESAAKVALTKAKLDPNNFEIVPHNSGFVIQSKVQQDALQTLPETSTENQETTQENIQEEEEVNPPQGIAVSEAKTEQVVSREQHNRNIVTATRLANKINNNVNDLEIVNVHGPKDLAKHPDIQTQLLSENGELNRFAQNAKAVFIPREYNSNNKDRVLIFTNKFVTPYEISGAILHETVGHYGIRKILGDDWVKFLNKIITTNPKAAKSAFNLANRWKGLIIDGNGNTILNGKQFLSESPQDGYFKLQEGVYVEPVGMAQLVDEYIAEEASKFAKKDINQDSKIKAFIKRAIGYIRHKLRSVFGIDSIKNITDNDIAYYLSQSYGMVMEGKDVKGFESNTSNTKVAYSADDVNRITTTILSRLPNKPKILLGSIKQIMNQKDIKQADKDLVQGILDTKFEGQTSINRFEFVSAVEDKLLPLSVNQDTLRDWADYGLGNIGRERYYYYRDNVNNISETHVWDGPFETPPNTNHFNDSNYIGHTRTFIEDDNYYVSEVQSDLVQKVKYGKELTDTEKSKIRNELDDMFKAQDILEEMEDGNVLEQAEQVRYKLRELNNERLNRFLVNIDYLEDNVSLTQIEEYVDDRILKLNSQLKLQTAPQGYDQFKNHIYERMAREEIKNAALQGYNTIRFPTGNTAAKIESWPIHFIDTGIEGINIPKSVGYNMFSKFRYFDRKGEYLHNLNFEFYDIQNKVWVDQAHVADTIKNNILEWYTNNNGSIIDPQYRGLFNIYEKQLRNMLNKEYKAKEVTDQYGYTWLEVNNISKYANEPTLAFMAASPQERQVENQKILDISLQDPKVIAEATHERIETIQTLNDQVANRDYQNEVFGKAKSFADRLLSKIESSKTGQFFDMFKGLPAGTRGKQLLRNSLGFAKEATELADKVSKYVFTKKLTSLQDEEIYDAWLNGSIANKTFKPDYLNSLQLTALYKLNDKLTELQDTLVNTSIFPNMPDELRNKIVESKGQWLHREYLTQVKAGARGGFLTSSIDWLRSKKDKPKELAGIQGEIRSAKYSIIKSVNMLARDLGLLDMYNQINEESKIFGYHWVLDTSKSFPVEYEGSIKNMTITAMWNNLENKKKILLAPESITHRTDNELAGIQRDIANLELAIDQYNTADLESVKQAMLKAGEPYSKLDKRGNVIPGSEKEISDQDALAFRSKNYEFMGAKKYPNMGALQNKWLDKRWSEALIADSVPINQAAMSFTENLYGMHRGSYLDKGNSFWKAFKTINNPGYWVRNFITSAVVTYLNSDASTATLTKYFNQEVHDMFFAKQGDKIPLFAGKKLSEWAIKKGMFSTNFAANELYAIKEALDGTLAQKAVKQTLTNKNFKESPMFFMNIAKDWLLELNNTLSKYNANMDGIFKLTLMRDYIEIHMKQKGIKSTVQLNNQYNFEQMNALMEAAGAYAAKGGFEYHDIPNWLKTFRRLPFGGPFLTWGYKMYGTAVRAAIRRPWKLAKLHLFGMGVTAAMLAMSDMDEDEYEKAVKDLPHQISNRSSIWVIPFKDQSGDLYYVDLTYILPQAFIYDTFLRVYNPQLGQSRTEATLESFKQNTNFLGGPIPQMISATLSGKDPFTKRDLWVKGESVENNLANYSQYFWNLAAPPFLGTYGIFADAVNANKLDEFGDDKNPFWSTDLISGMGITTNTYNPNKERIRKLRKLRSLEKEIKQVRYRKIHDRNLSRDDKVKARMDAARRLKELKQQFKEGN